MSNFLIYGANGYTGELITRYAAERGMRPILAGRNAIAIIIPCHRVIGANGTLTGYGGGLDRKRALLALEAPAPFAARCAA